MWVVRPLVGDSEPPGLSWIFHFMESLCVVLCLCRRCVCLSGKRGREKEDTFFLFSRTMRRHPFSRAAEEKGKHLAKASVEPSLT